MLGSPLRERDEALVRGKTCQTRATTILSAGPDLPEKALACRSLAARCVTVFHERNRHREVPLKPIVGVTSVPKMAHSGYGDTPHESAPELYLDALAQAGATTVILPVHAEPDERLFALCDAFLLTGGGDVDPARYEGTPNERVYGVDDERDEYETALVRLRGGQRRSAACDLPRDPDPERRSGRHARRRHLDGTAGIAPAPRSRALDRHVPHCQHRCWEHPVQARRRGVGGELDAPPGSRTSGERARARGLGARRHGGSGRVRRTSASSSGCSGTRSASGAAHPAFPVFEGFVEAARDRRA